MIFNTLTTSEIIIFTSTREHMAVDETLFIIDKKNRHADHKTKHGKKKIMINLKRTLVCLICNSQSASITSLYTSKPPRHAFLNLCYYIFLHAATFFYLSIRVTLIFKALASIALDLFSYID